MTAYNNTDQIKAGSDELLRLRREQRRERRRRQINAFYKSIGAQNADKVIFLFEPDMNIA